MQAKTAESLLFSEAEINRLKTRNFRKPITRRGAMHGKRQRLGQRPSRTGRRGAKDKKKPGSHLLSRRKGTIIGAGELDFRVRDGNGYCLSAMAAGQ